MTRYTVCRCPVCKSPAHVRTSRKLSSISMERRLVCSNDACGQRWIELWEACEIILPKSRPDPYQKAAELFDEPPPAPAASSPLPREAA